MSLKKAAYYTTIIKKKSNESCWVLPAEKRSKSARVFRRKTAQCELETRVVTTNIDFSLLMFTALYSNILMLKTFL